ncbi:2-polyprenyl-6-methoxyphenol hydroxylase-like FAD-dependent oxidoreductase [Actinoplanes tereljensis]|uniref:Uncharacterized protein n=1 Tax=Paractinoplanes tereljensis TaxID=571912 RepID=A0A919NPP5_9ACTN|nr:hypothetical protein [Actinoplanes tereljensis]GIF21791.1 hypothetical protein Ate02nite_45210 [Actinoplanes tereljensis]
MPAARRFAVLSSSTTPANPRVLFRQAVVLGGSVAGLMAARVLSDHAEQVLIIERDDLAALDLPDERAAAEAAPRPGVPQGSQVHALLPSGINQLQRWFPGSSRRPTRPARSTRRPARTGSISTASSATNLRPTRTKKR